MAAAGNSHDPGSEEPAATVGLSTALDRRHAWAQLFGDAPEPEPVHIGHFRVVRRLGAGGMGVVYEARDERLGRAVAVKLLRGGPRAADASAARLLREARAMALVAHPNVVTVHEVGEHAGRTFIAMERVEGRTLREWAALAPRTTEEILGVFVQAARGLAAAHAAGLVHRDFKPENVLVGDDGRVRVVDFGLARTRDGGDPWLGADVVGRDPASLDVRMTATGAIAGTPAYMAPEQWHSREPDHRADQFAWAVALWELLYGKRPHAGASVGELAEAVTRGPAPRAVASARVPAWLGAILERALAVEPAARFASMNALLDALSRGGEAEMPRRRGRVVALGGGVVGVGAIAAVVLWPPATIVDPCPDGMSRIPGNDALAPYCLDRAEVTVAQWLACVDAGVCEPEPRTAYNDLEQGEAGAALLAEISKACTTAAQLDHPVNCVTHLQAAKMCEWRDARLPTDDEWQWAAHGADKQWPYPWGVGAPDATVCITVDWRNPLQSTCPVAPEKLHDRSPQSVVGLVGNVWEWTSTRLGPADADARIYRGGGFRNRYTGPWPEAADGSPRAFWGESTFKDPELGFRCARSLPDAG